MAFQDKINIYVPREIGIQIYNDAMLFEIFKKDHKTINRNRFLSMLLCGYYDNYSTENKHNFDLILDIIDNSSLSMTEQVEIADRILKEVILPIVPKRKGKKPICLSLKPTIETEHIIHSIENELSGRDYFSQYFCRMLISYCRKPISEREKIIFYDNYSFLQNACNDRRSIIFSLIWDETILHEVIPYAISTGTEEMFNYLICEEKNTQTGILEARSYRLNRLTHLGYGRNTKKISEEVRAQCDLTISMSPQYAINSDEEICVLLNDVGEKLYNRIYYGRPRYNRIVDCEEGHYYFFQCSPIQIFHYFRRFDNNTAIIISPESLKQKMINFHESSLLAYKRYENKGVENNV